MSFKVRNNLIIIYILWSVLSIISSNKIVIEKRFYNRETIRGIRILQLAKISPLYHHWLRIKELVDYSSCIEGLHERKLVYFLSRRGNCFSIIQSLFSIYSNIEYRLLTILFLCSFQVLEIDQIQLKRFLQYFICIFFHLLMILIYYTPKTMLASSNNLILTITYLILCYWMLSLQCQRFRSFKLK